MTETESRIGWSGDVPEGDLALLDRAPGGSLSETGRQAAIEASLSLLGVYFAAGAVELAERSAVGLAEQDRDLDALQAGLRLRVAVAAGRRLADLLESILRRPTFRYELRGTEQVGSLTGPLDVNRWIARADGGQELSFPVLEVRRGLHTPENVLAAYATLWLLRELHAVLSVSLATAQTVDYQAARRLEARLNRALQRPAFSACTHAAATIRTDLAVRRLLNDSKRRLRRREIPNSRPYESLIRWLEECLSGTPAITAGQVDLAVYGDRFDSKLFELWCLGVLGRALAEALSLPEPSVHPAWRRAAPAYRFDAFSGQLDLYFQRGLGTIDARHVGQWVMASGQRLGGIPDIVVRARPLLGGDRYAILDPKLRQRSRLPAEELYKVLGYLHNFQIEPAVGVALIYTTLSEPAAPTVFHDTAAGALISVALNPASAAATTMRLLDEVVKILLALIDYVPAGVSSGDPAGGEDPTELVVASQRAALITWANSHAGDIEPSRHRIETLIGQARWQALDDQVQTMMATADFLGHQVTKHADFSGPVIGLCAAIEYVLHDLVITPATQGGTYDPPRTFGAVIAAMEIACQGQGNQMHHDIKNFLITNNVDLSRVLALVPRWRQLNALYRIPAAHREVLNNVRWQQLYRLVLGAEDLFNQTFDVLHQ